MSQDRYAPRRGQTPPNKVQQPAPGAVSAGAAAVAAVDTHEAGGASKDRHLQGSHAGSRPLLGGPAVPTPSHDSTAVRIPLGPLGSVNAGFVSLVVLVLQNSVLVLMTRWSRSRDDRPITKTSTMVLMTELVKMAACLSYAIYEFWRDASFPVAANGSPAESPLAEGNGLSEWQAHGGAASGGPQAVGRTPEHKHSARTLQRSHTSPETQPEQPAEMPASSRAVVACERLSSSVLSMETVKLVVPAALFTFQNYLLFVSLANLDAMTFQVLSQVKLLLAALFSIWLLGRYLNCVQWSSVFLLMFGIAIASAPSKASSSNRGAGAAQNNLLGVVSCVASGLSSSFASVYFEKILKGTPPSIAIRNVQLGVSAIGFAMMSVFLVDGIPIMHFEPFRGFTFLSWVLVCVHAGGGVLVAIVVKYADNILKGFATGIAIVVSGGYAALMWGFTPSSNFILGSVLVCIGTVMYNMQFEHPIARRLARGMPGGSRIPPTPLTPPGLQPTPKPPSVVPRAENILMGRSPQQQAGTFGAARRAASPTFTPGCSASPRPGVLAPQTC
eukprot:TRINITY_DN6451_c0_g1_i1.p1 TRINITY_DN6451_c0_g1~~TRINITY_DN6451_c0_g1_i1.p1  ORF type:complete len:557 (+),score=96.15 TRINITY_DN6451_c0_g1_i1:86-1756(+)